MQTVIMAHDQLLAGSADIVVAGGMESMSNAPYLLDRARSGYRMGHGKVLDHMFLDGLEDAYDKGRLMGRSEEHTFELQPLMRISYAVFCLKNKKHISSKIECTHIQYMIERAQHQPSLWPQPRT